jgi:hypothetical protein
MNHFTDQELQTLSAEIDSQLIELAKDPASVGIQKHIGHTVPAKQKQQLEQVIEQDLGTKEPADSFMKKFARAAKQDLCLEGGVLYGQWKKYGDLENEAMLKTFSGVLIGMGISNALLATAVVAVSVIVIHIGVKAFCEDCQ